MNEHLKNKFINDPDWKEIEKIIHSYIDPLLDIKTIDTKKSGDEVKAELILRVLYYEQLNKFLVDCQLLQDRNSNTTTFR